MKFLPRMRWIDLPASDAVELDLSPMYAWRALVFEWFDFGMVIACKHAERVADEYTIVMSSRGKASETPSEGHDSMLFSLGEAKGLVAFFGGSNTEVMVAEKPQGTTEDGDVAPAGKYAWCAEYPEEGACWLGEQDFDTEEHDDSTPSEACAYLQSAFPRGVAGGGDAFDILAHLQRQREWSERTFGPGMRTAGVCDHIRKELREIEAEPKDVSEWIDVVILALDGAWRAGYSPREIVDAIAAKQAKNEARTWPDWRTMPTDKAIEHDRSVEDHA